MLLGQRRHAALDLDDRLVVIYASLGVQPLPEVVHALCIRRIMTAHVRHVRDNAVLGDEHPGTANLFALFH